MDNERPSKRLKCRLPRFRTSRSRVSWTGASLDTDDDFDTVMVVNENDDSVERRDSIFIPINETVPNDGPSISASDVLNNERPSASNDSGKDNDTDNDSEKTHEMENDNFNDNSNKSQNNGNLTPKFNFESNTIKDRFVSVFNKSDYSDVVFIVGPNDASAVRFPAHKVVLGVASPVFNAMFNGPMASQETEIEVPDLEPKAFHTFLRFLYTDEINLDHDTVMGTLYAAKKYAITALETHCVSFLKSNLNGDNVFLVLNQSRLFDQNDLEKACLKKIDKCTNELLNSESFLQLDKESLCWLLERDTLSVKETDLFEATINWAKHECGKRNIPNNGDNLRDVLGNALQLIRFPTMQPKEFSETVVDHGILKQSEVIEIFRYLSSDPRPSIPYPKTPRNSYSIQNKLVLRRFDGIADPQPAIGCQEIRFAVDRAILLGGIGLFTAKYGPFKYNSYIDIKDCSNDQMVASHRTLVNCNGAPSTYRLWFKKPVKIKPKNMYEATVISTNPRTYCGVRGKSSITLKLEDNESVTFQFFNSNDSKIYCPAHDGGQIPEFLFFV